MSSGVVNYNASVTGRQFHLDNSFVRGIMGPIGSGKSVACCFEVYRRAQMQEPGKDKIRRSRWLIVRNTLPQLETTTIKTWQDWFPESVFGRMTRKPPYTQMIRHGLGDGTELELEVIFIALDKPEDVKKLLSFECTGIWFNEAREIHKELLDAATGRVGRFPSKKDKPDHIHPDNWPTWRGVIMDTNPPDDSHWWYTCAVEDTPNKWSFFQQPSGLSKEAENVDNLPKGYYEDMCAGKTKEWVDVYVHGKYGFIQDGKPVYGSSWNDSTHTSKDILKPIEGREVYVGVDFGRTPCAIYAQKTDRGGWVVMDELITEDMSTQQFATLVNQDLSNKFYGCTPIIYGDPAGQAKHETSELTSFEIMRNAGLTVRPAPTNKPSARIEAVTSALIRLVDGKPAFRLSPKCKILRRGFNGGYKYKRLSVSGDARYTPEPDKNRFSHPHDALQYLLAGGGEYNAMLGRNRRAKKTVVMNNGWNVF